MKLLFIILCSISTALSFACTTFCINKNGQILFGRNYDWVTGVGIVHTNHRGHVKTSAVVKDGKTTQWISKYGSTTFNQYGKEFPTGGMNEKGLVVEVMWLPETKFPSADQRPALSELQWVQYQLDNAATVSEVVSSDTSVRISATSTPLHFLIADASGNVASIEYLFGKMVVHTGKQLPFPVLSNNTYNQSAKLASTMLNKKDIATGDNSLDRYVAACNMIGDLQAESIKMPLTDYAFSILEKVAQGDFTKWQIVYDITNRKIHFRTQLYKNIKTFGLAGFNYTCHTPPLMYNMNQSGSGIITANFSAPDPVLKEQIIRQASLESRSHVTISEEEQNFLVKYEETVRCKN